MSFPHECSRLSIFMRMIYCERSQIVVFLRAVSLSCSFNQNVSMNFSYCGDGNVVDSDRLRQTMPNRAYQTIRCRSSRAWRGIQALDVLQIKLNDYNTWSIS